MSGLDRLRITNAIRDARDKARGVCCAAPSGALSDGGYHFWRCALKRGHDGPHRTGVYIWSEGERPEHDPSSEVHGTDRFPVFTRRQARVRQRSQEMHRLRLLLHERAAVRAAERLTAEAAAAQEGEER